MMKNIRFIPYIAILALFLVLGYLYTHKDSDIYTPIKSATAQTQPTPVPVTASQTSNTPATQAQASTKSSTPPIVLPHAPVIDYSIINQPTVTAPVVNYPITPPKPSNCHPIVYTSPVYVCD